MNQEFPEQLAERVRETAGVFPYPPTPDIARVVTRRLSAESQPARQWRPQLAWAVGVIVVAMAGLLAVPQVRAAVAQFIQIGVVRIFVGAPTPTPESLIATLPTTATPQAFETSTPLPTPTSPLSLLVSLAGETTLEKAQARATFRIRLPTYPSDLGPPDRVFVQDQGGTVVILVWVQADDPDHARLSLHQLPPDSWGVKKMNVNAIQSTTVNGQPAVWAEGPYMLFYRNGETIEQRLVEGHVLIWEQNGVTYRLETDASLEEAVKIAESLK
jgi:hypothetical protein